MKIFKNMSLVFVAMFSVAAQAWAGVELFCSIRETGGISLVSGHASLEDNRFVKLALRASSNTNVWMYARLGLIYPDQPENIVVSLRDEASGWEVNGDAISQKTINVDKQVEIKLSNCKTGEYFVVTCLKRFQ